MSLSIVELMKQPKHDLTWLQNALHSAMKLELFTLPPYLCGYWALKDKESYPATQIKDIVYQEMLHFGLTCNMLCATGKKPQMLQGYKDIIYPSGLPGGVVPQCDKNLIPCDPHFQVMLGFSDFKAFTWMSAQIEYPENPTPHSALAETYPTIGQFYDAVLEAFHLNDAQIAALHDGYSYDTTNQQKGALGVFYVSNLDTATSAIKLIQQQGEGGYRNPYYGGNHLSHFYAFGELYFGQKYVYNAANETGNWSGDKVTITADQYYNMTPVPLGGYTNPPSEVTDCDALFTSMLTQLESAWSEGGAKALSAAMKSMGLLRDKVKILLGAQLARNDGQAGIYGPQFRLAVVDRGPSRFGVESSGSNASMSFAADIKPLFRAIDIEHMKVYGYLLDDYTFMSDPTDDHANAAAVFSSLQSQEMPPGGPFWTQAQLDLFSNWMAGGYKA
ncbi:MAG: membrane protein [Nitrosospira sp.]